MSRISTSALSFILIALLATTLHALPLSVHRMRVSLYHEPEFNRPIHAVDVTAYTCYNLFNLHVGSFEFEGDGTLMFFDDEDCKKSLFKSSKTLADTGDSGYVQSMMLVYGVPTMKGLTNLLEQDILQ